jgi:hypothetical protein
VANEGCSKRNDAAPACPKCGAAMEDVVTIAPVAGDPGLIAYECPKCHHVTSVLVDALRSNGHEFLP